MKQKQKREGFSSLVTLMIVALAAIPIIGGWYLWVTQEERDSKCPL